MQATIPDRKRVLDALLTAATRPLAQAYEALSATMPQALPVRGPEIGMVMLRGRIGGGGQPFNLGEATVTRATVRLESGEIGHAVLLGRDMEKARMVAHLDALAQRDDWRATVETRFVAPALEAEAEERRRRVEEVEATRVDFFTMVRGED
ncbi:phosphonate C-P lyase system protein PhnG [Rhizobium sp. YJ-22]|uniref:phosphonate C-P lyase system protein PhnG n=1 Tax=Rhizobium sp. YJ-22 TaxID=3037556 RepID=UPI0024124779|nr:phosphonate C-P lyase system protein PhnG [Rhizobium sp. YJ-22]MDG3576612.1 phosphonate C-P lyase system protein PhnG [Rhizobium sp. YJ-22]